MKEDLSSKWTLPSKIFNFAMWCGSLVGVTVAIVKHESWPATFEFIPAMAALIVWILFFAFVNHRLKFAEMDDQFLYVRRWFVYEKIPLAEIASISLTTIGFVWVRVRFKSDTKFGKQIFFMPTFDAALISALGRSHPVVTKLQNAVAATAS